MGNRDGRQHVTMSWRAQRWFVRFTSTIESANFFTVSKALSNVMKQNELAGRV